MLLTFLSLLCHDVTVHSILDKLCRRLGSILYMHKDACQHKFQFLSFCGSPYKNGGSVHVQKDPAGFKARCEVTVLNAALLCCTALKH